MQKQKFHRQSYVLAALACPQFDEQGNETFSGKNQSLFFYQGRTIKKDEC